MSHPVCNESVDGLHLVQHVLLRGSVDRIVRLVTLQMEAQKNKE